MDLRPILNAQNIGVILNNTLAIDRTKQPSHFGYHSTLSLQLAELDAIVHQSLEQGHIQVVGRAFELTNADMWPQLLVVADEDQML